MKKVKNLQEILLELLLEAFEGDRYNMDQVKKDLKADDDLLEKWGIDSLDIVEFQLRVQDKLEIEIEQEDYGVFTSLNTLENYLAEKHNIVHEG